MKNIIRSIALAASLIGLTLFAAAPNPILYGPGTTNTPLNWSNVVRAVAGSVSLSSVLTNNLYGTNGVKITAIQGTNYVLSVTGISTNPTDGSAIFTGNGAGLKNVPVAPSLPYRYLISSSIAGEGGYTNISLRTSPDLQTYVPFNPSANVQAVTDHACYVPAIAVLSNRFVLAYGGEGTTVKRIAAMDSPDLINWSGTTYDLGTESGLVNGTAFLNDQGTNYLFLSETVPALSLGFQTYVTRVKTVNPVTVDLIPLMVCNGTNGGQSIGKALQVFSAAKCGGTYFLYGLSYSNSVAMRVTFTNTTGPMSTFYTAQTNNTMNLRFNVATNPAGLWVSQVKNSSGVDSLWQTEVSSNAFDWVVQSNAVPSLPIPSWSSVVELPSSYQATVLESSRLLSTNLPSAVPMSTTYKLYTHDTTPVSGPISMITAQVLGGSAGVVFSRKYHIEYVGGLLPDQSFFDGAIIDLTLIGSTLLTNYYASADPGITATIATDTYTARLVVTANTTVLGGSFGGGAEDGVWTVTETVTPSVFYGNTFDTGASAATFFSGTIAADALSVNAATNSTGTTIKGQLPVLINGVTYYIDLKK